MTTTGDRIDAGGVRIAAESIAAQLARKAQADADRLMTSYFATEVDLSTKQTY